MEISSMPFSVLIRYEFDLFDKGTFDINSAAVQHRPGRVSPTSIQDQVGANENVWDHFGVAKRKGLGTADLDSIMNFLEIRVYYL